MLQIISAFSFFIFSVLPMKDYVSLNTYISENAKLYCPIYFIYYEEITDIVKKDELVEKNKDDFIAYLKHYNVECVEIGGYFFFRKKTSD